MHSDWPSFEAWLDKRKIQRAEAQVPTSIYTETSPIYIDTSFLETGRSPKAALNKQLLLRPKPVEKEVRKIPQNNTTRFIESDIKRKKPRINPESSDSSSESDIDILKIQSSATEKTIQEAVGYNEDSKTTAAVVMNKLSG